MITVDRDKAREYLKDYFDTDEVTEQRVSYLVDLISEEPSESTMEFFLYLVSMETEDEQ